MQFIHIRTTLAYLKASSFVRARARDAFGRAHRTHTRTHERWRAQRCAGTYIHTTLPHSANVALHMQHESRAPRAPSQRRVISAYVISVCGAACVHAYDRARSSHCVRFSLYLPNASARRRRAIEGVRGRSTYI